jgi:hypothetical protein
MTTLCTVTINAPTKALDKQHQEVAYIQRALHQAAVDIRANGGKKTSGNILDDGATVVGTFSYVPVATS